MKIWKLIIITFGLIAFVIIFVVDIYSIASLKSSNHLPQKVKQHKVIIVEIHHHFKETLYKDGKAIDSLYVDSVVFSQK